MLPIQYTTVQYSTVTGEEDGVTPTFHSVWCQRAGLAVCHQCKKCDRGRGKKGRRGPAWVWGSD